MLNRTGEGLQEISLNIVGSSSFAKYKFISNEKTINCYISDDALVPYPGYKSVLEGLNGKGRGEAVTRDNKIVAVFGRTVYLINMFFNALTDDYTYDYSIIGELQTDNSYVFIAENIVNQIIFSDNRHLYIYSSGLNPNFQVINIDFVPGKIIYKNGYFIVNSIGTSEWRLSLLNDGTSFPYDAQHVGSLETKADKCVAIASPPEGGNVIFVFGRNCVEPWFNVGQQIFPFQKNQSFNIDYGVVRPETIAVFDEMVVWLAQNEKAGIKIMYSTGSGVESITTDGIAHFFSNLSHPDDCEAFIYYFDNHIFYHINFYRDNVSLFYDFNTGKFFHASDEDNNYFIARNIVNLNNRYYFISKDTNKLYALHSIYTNYDGKEIPRTRITKTYRRKNQRPYIALEFGFTVEQGDTNYNYQNLGKYEVASEKDQLVNDDLGNQVLTSQDQIRKYVPRIDFSVSEDGAESFGNFVTHELNPIGNRLNILREYYNGMTNAFTLQCRFYNTGRIICTDGNLIVRNL